MSANGDFTGGREFHESDTPDDSTDGVAPEHLMRQSFETEGPGMILPMSKPKFSTRTSAEQMSTTTSLTDQQPPLKHGKRHTQHDVATRRSWPGKTRASTGVKLSAMKARWHIWRREIFCCMLVVGAIAALTGTLQRRDKRPLPKLPLDISINAVISIYTVVFVTAAMTVLGSGINAVKWTCFRQSRRLYDMAVFDNASRGWLGAVQLLYNAGRVPVVTSLGALTIVMALIVEPVTQQLLHFYDCSVPLANVQATIARANVYEISGSQLDSGLSTVPFENVAAASAGLYRRYGPNDGLQVPWTCTTGNCTFQHTYSSIAYCASCEDATHRLRYQYTGTSPGQTISNITLASANLTLQWQQDQINLIAGGNETANGSISIISYDGAAKAEAYTCNIHPCIHTFNATLKAGKLQETIVDRSPSVLSGLNFHIPDDRYQTLYSSDADYTSVIIYTA